MRILHALVGYLAVTALPFLAFASPLAAIDYDGYVNTTHNHARMKQALGSIVETSEQNQKDSALMKRAPASDDIIEARQVAIGIPVVGAITLIVIGAIATLVWIESDEPKRESFTQNTISDLISKYPKYNWLICHSPYSTGFDGVEGTDWGYTHHELGISFGRTIGYDLFWAKSGTFYRYGDGGFENWAYNGKIGWTDNNGATVHFDAMF